NFAGAATSAVATLTVNTNANPNAAPVLAAIGNKLVSQGGLLTFTAAATDADFPGQSLTYSLAPDAPAGASINSASGLFTWIPGPSQGPGTNTVTIRVVDNGSPPLSDAQQVTIRVLIALSTNVSLIATGSIWKYRDTGQDLGM